MHAEEMEIILISNQVQLFIINHNRKNKKWILIIKKNYKQFNKTFNNSQVYIKKNSENTNNNLIR